jgi:hypothetical protein
MPQKNPESATGWDATERKTSKKMERASRK